MMKSKTVNFAVKVIFSYTDQVKEFNNFPVEIVYEDNPIFYFNDFVNNLSKNVNVENKVVSYYDQDLRYFVYCGIFPFKAQIIIPYDEEKMNNIEEPYSILIKIREIQTQLNLLKMELIEENHDNLDEQNQNMHINEKSKRSKERKIGYIIEKVFLWRKLYSGFIDDNGNMVKLTLEEAAERVGISKKSLDDYLIQLRIGKQNGFNFNEHKNDKVGVLRAFVKKQKSINENKYLTNHNLELNCDE
jgi:hypothetical protein